MNKLIAGALVALALPLAAATADAKPNHTKSPARACKQLRADMGRATFKATYGNFGGCVAKHQRKSSRTQKALEAQANAAQTCQQQRSDMGEAAFREQYGANGNGHNAFGKCVSTLAKAKHSEAEHGRSDEHVPGS
jgi:hypothetical protein